MRRSRVFLKNAVILCLTSVIIRVCGIAFNAYIIGKIGTTGMGMFQLVMSVYMLFVSLGGAGISMATMRIVAEELTERNHAGILSTVRKTLLLALLTSLGAGAAMCVGADYIADIWLAEPDTAAGIRILAASIPFIALSSVFKGYFTAMRRVPKVSVTDALEQVAYMSMSILLLSRVASGSPQDMFIALTLADTLAEMLSLGVFVLLFIGDRRRHLRPRGKAAIATGRILHISLPVATNSFLRSGISSLNKLLVPFSLQQYGLSKSAALGDYGVVHGMVFPILQLPELILTSFASLLVPEFAEFYQKNDARSIRRAMDIIFRNTFLFSIGMVGAFSYFGRDICELAYGDASAGVYLALLAPYAMLLYLDRVVDNTLTGLHRQVNSMVYNVVESLLSTALIIVLVPRLGMVGYIMVLFIGKAINMWMSFAGLVRVTDFPLPFFRWVIQPAICVLASISIVALLRSAVAYEGWAVWLLAAAAIYMALLAASGSLKYRAS